MELFRKFASASSQAFSQKGRCGLQHCRVQVGCLTDSQQVDIDGVQKVHLRIFADARLVSSLLARMPEERRKKRRKGRKENRRVRIGRWVSKFIFYYTIQNCFAYV
jgi:hypothetical protein